MGKKKPVVKNVTAENEFTDAIAAIESQREGYVGFLNISIKGTAFTGTVSLLRSFDGGTTWYVVKQYITDAEERLEEREREVLYRLGVQTGDFGSGAVDVRLSR